MAEQWQGPAELRPLLRPVDQLRTHPDNPRRGDLPMIVRSLTEFGQLKPVIVHDLDGEPTIFAGNHTYRAALELGWTQIAVSEPAYMSDDEAEAYLHMDNRSSDLSTYDYGELESLLAERQEAGTLERTGYTDDDLDRLRAEAAAISGAALDEFREGRDDDDQDDPPRREEGTGEPVAPLRQMVLTFRPPETFDDFARMLQALRKAFGTEDVSSTVAEAVGRAFKMAAK